MALSPHSGSLVAAALDGDRRAWARLITLVESGGPAANAALASLFPHTGGAWTVGITGAPGAGKSTITDGLISIVRAGGQAVGVVAVDPSSPFTGGAILGDRIRMQEHASDGGVYIRSLASRGHLGGISAATPRALVVLDAVGLPVIFVETVGVGQAEVEIVENVDTTVVVVTPGWGDSIQAAKAGLLEIGDVFVVNKADRPGVEETARDLEHMLDFGDSRAWRPPVVRTVASTGDGVTGLWEAIERHRQHLHEDGRLEGLRRARLENELRNALVDELQRRVDTFTADDPYRTALDEALARRLDPWSAAERLAATS